MAGHSKWASIKHKKAITDSKKGKNFTRVAKMIATASRNGSDPEKNPSLALAIEKAKALNVPKVNIERAINKGKREGGDKGFESFLYAGFGPEGVAFLIMVATDNKKRAVSEIRAELKKRGGELVISGSVLHLFSYLGKIEIELSDQVLSKEKIEEIIINSGAKDYELKESSFFIYTEPTDLDAVERFLTEEGLDILEAGLYYVPKIKVSLKSAELKSEMIGLFNALDELCDVVSVCHNLEPIKEKN